jgi:hypothetical protein
MAHLTRRETAAALLAHDPRLRDLLAGVGPLERASYEWLGRYFNCLADTGQMDEVTYDDIVPGRGAGTGAG